MLAIAASMIASFSKTTIEPLFAFFVWFFDDFLQYLGHIRSHLIGVSSHLVDQ
jgi:hypothetical protein